MGKIRGFEVAKGYEDMGINLPIQSTNTSAGYDFESAEDRVIYPIWGYLFSNIGTLLHIPKNADKEHQETLSHSFRPTLIKTGIKAYMKEDEALFLYNRSSNPLNLFLLLANGVGVVDSDYYENEKNDGHIMFQFINFGLFPRHIKKGDKIGQGIFKTFHKADEGKARIKDDKRSGGFGSTN